MMRKVLIYETEKSFSDDCCDYLKNIYHVDYMSGKYHLPVDKIAVYEPDILLINLKGDCFLEKVNFSKKLLDNKKIPILFLSDKAEKLIVENILPVNADNYFIFPVDIQLLHHKIEISIQKHLKIFFQPTQFENYFYEQKDCKTLYRSSTQKKVTSKSPLYYSRNKKIEIVNNRFMKQYWVLEE